MDKGEWRAAGGLASSWPATRLSGGSGGRGWWCSPSSSAGICLALFLYLGETREASSLRRLLDLEGVHRATDPQWVVRLERFGWIAALTRGLRRLGLEFLVTLMGLLLGLVALILSVPLVVVTFLTPYRLSRDKFYFDEIYNALVVWPLRIVA